MKKLLLLLVLLTGCEPIPRRKECKPGMDRYEENASPRLYRRNSKWRIN